MQLTTGTLLKQGEYRIDSFIGQGGFGITYKGTWFTQVKGPLGTINAQLPVAIKEFFFEDYCSRNDDTRSITIHSTTGKDLFSRFKEKLKKEAEILSNLVHPNIVKVLEVFEENNTAYMVMDYIEGESLKEVLTRDKKLRIPVAINYIKQIAAALVQVHQNNILHLDVKPGNIIIAKRDGKPMLIDFGISKRYNTTNGETSTTPLGRSKGYAPIEQYFDKGAAAFAPSLDVYALGATLYHCVTGEVPMEANERSVSSEFKTPTLLNSGVPPSLEKVILKAMELSKEKRYQTIAAFAKDLDPEEADKTEMMMPLSSAVPAATASEIVAAVDPVLPVPDAATTLADTHVTRPENNFAPAINSSLPPKKNFTKLLVAAGIVALFGLSAWYFIANHKTGTEEPVIKTLQEINDSTFNALMATYYADTTKANFMNLFNFTKAHEGYTSRLDSVWYSTHSTMSQKNAVTNINQLKPDTIDDNGQEIYNEVQLKKSPVKAPANEKIKKKSTNKEGEEIYNRLSLKDQPVNTTPIKKNSNKHSILDSLRLPEN